MRIVLWSGLFLLMAATACQSDSKDTKYEELVLGRWEVREALRDGQPTETLTGAFMEFLPEGRMITNISGAEEESDYTLEENVISSKSRRMPADYQIQYLGDSSMVLRFTIRNTPFQFSLARAAEEPLEE